MPIMSCWDSAGEYSFQLEDEYDITKEGALDVYTDHSNLY